LANAVGKWIRTEGLEEMTKLTRRKFVALTGAAGVTLIAPGCSEQSADAVYPQRDITFIIPNGPGGNFDSFVRVIAPAMQKYLPNDVNIVPLNVPAGGGGKGLADLYRSRPDGYTIGAVNIPGAFTLQEQMGANSFVLSEMTWLGTIAGGETYAIVVAPDSPYQTVDDLRALSQQRPVKFASTGPEGTSYAAIKVASEILGLDTQIISGYRGSSDYIVATIRGDSDCAVATLSTLRSFLEGQTVRLAVSFEEESSVPGVPDATDIGLPELSQIRVERMVAAPPGLPDDIRQVLNSALDKAVRDPDVVAWAEEAGHPWIPQAEGNGDAVMQEQAAFFEKWKSVILS
jgi:tripartite-type tricarboxylate transporter receptor subunit TctC